MRLPNCLDGHRSKALHAALQPDNWRKTHPFTADIELANKVMLHPFATDAERATAMRCWLQKNQPCLFGRISAQQNRIHICVVSESDLDRPDTEIKEKIQAHRILWKQRSLMADPPEHGFVLLVCSPRLAYAAPDMALKEFVTHLRSLYETEMSRDLEGNDIAWETLYLQHPADPCCAQFRFSLDFFAAQGDQRWWHDHRVPGGIAFTANSVGYMVRWREWYEKKTDQLEWALSLAMQTVDLAARTQWGPAIWLRPLRGGKTLKNAGECPLHAPQTLKPNLVGMDWTAYAGYLSTDHSIRQELFRSEPEPPATETWNMDLTYLFSSDAPGFREFMGEVRLSVDDVHNIIGNPADRRILSGMPAQEGSRSARYEREISGLIAKMESEWALDVTEFD